MKPPLSEMERAALEAWRAWGASWALYTACSQCDEVKQCRGRSRHAMLCLDCYDTQ